MVKKGSIDLPWPYGLFVKIVEIPKLKYHEETK